MESCFLLDVVVSKCPSIFELFSSKDQPLLIGWDSLFVLDLSFDIFDRVRWLHIKSDGFTSEGFDEDLHSSSES